MDGRGRQQGQERRRRVQAWYRRRVPQVEGGHRYRFDGAECDEYHEHHRRIQPSPRQPRQEPLQQRYHASQGRGGQARRDRHRQRWSRCDQLRACS